MEQKLFDFYNRIKGKKPVAFMEAVLFPLILIVFSYININKGIDLTDATYSLSNARFLETLDSSWFGPVLYSHFVTRLLLFLPGGTTLLGMNIYSNIFKCLMGLTAYYFFTAFMGFDRLMVFLAELVCLGLCWCPVTILYNYLTYFLFLGSIVLIFAGLKTGKNKYLVIAGFLLGCNVFVRFANLVEAGLIVIVWGDAILKKSKAKEWICRTLWCVAGFAIAFVPAVIVICVTRGIPAYISGITDLFEMTGTNTAYSGSGMIRGIINAYIYTWTWLEHAVLFELLILLASLVLPRKLNALRYILSGVFTMVLLALLYKKALFSFDYRNFGPVCNFGKLIVCFAILLFVAVLFVKKETNENRLLALSGLAVIAITPLGTNNEIYANLNFMFWVLPVFLYLLCRFISTNEYLRGVRFSVLILTAAFAFQSICFGATYRFRDGETAPMNTKVECNSVLAGMYTTEENATVLRDITEIWQKNSYAEGTVLLFGNVSGFGFVFDTPIAISSSWPTLPSYLERTYVENMEGLNTAIDNGTKKAPVVVISSEELQGVMNSDGAKQEILKNFLEKYNYIEIYNNPRLSIYAAE